MGTPRLIAIVDDDDAVRRSTAQLMQGAGCSVEAFASGDSFLAAPLGDDFACVVLDMRMPGLSGLDVLRMLAERDEAPPVVVVTGHGDIALAVEAMKLGAIDFIEKPYPPDALLAVIDRAREMRASSRASTALSREAAAQLESLTERQRQVLGGIVRGQPNKIIAYELGLSIRTVEAYRAQLLARLGARSTAEAIRIAIAAGLDSGGNQA